MKLSPRLIVATISLTLAGAGGWWWNQAGHRRDQVAARLPAMPDLTPAPVALQERIAVADTRARSRGSALAGLIELSRLYHANGYLDAAMVCYAGLADLQPAQPRWPHRHATILSGYGQAEPALAQWERTITLAPAYLTAHLRRADLLFKTSRIDEARLAYRAALDLERDNAWALLGLARIDLEAERWREARRRLERIVALTNYALGYDLIVPLYERLGENDRAEAIRGRAAASGAYRDPTDPWLDALMEDCYDSFRLALEAGTKSRHGDQTTAVRWLQRAIEVSPDDVSAHFQLAGLLAELNDFPGAMHHYRRCTQLDPAFADGWAQLSALHARRGNRAQADRLLAAGLDACPDSPGLHRMRARRLRDGGQVGAAIAEFRTAIRLRPNEPDPYLELGMTLLGSSRREEGLREIVNALKWDPLNPTGLGIMAFDAIEEGDRERANHWLAQIARQPRFDKAQAERLHDIYYQAFNERWSGHDR